MKTLTPLLSDRSWHRLFFVVFIATTISVASHIPTAKTIVNIWSTSETFAHGFFVLPIFLWLLYRLRDPLSELPIAPNWALLPSLIGTGMLWLVSTFAGIQVGAQLSIVMTLILLIAILFGKAITRKILFPLAFLLFMAPVGEEIVPQLMEITADLTVYAIRLTGVPIYREGLFFSLPSGNWSVVEACSGIRYLIAALMLGSLFAYLNLTTLKRRVIFIFLSAIIPIAANSVRAYIIVMLGHFSGNKLATGVDHLIYGWLFFGLVMFMLFSFGAMLAKGEKRQLENTITHAKTSKDKPYQLVAVVSAVCISIWPIWNSASTKYEPINANELNNPFDALVQYTQPNSSASLTSWQPTIAGQDKVFTKLLDSKSNELVRATAYLFVDQFQGKEMISSGNILVHSSDETWRIVQSSLVTLKHNDDRTAQVHESIIRSKTQTIRVWRWYEVGNNVLASSIQTKLSELLSRILLKREISSTVILVANEPSTTALEKVAKELIWPLHN